MNRKVIILFGPILVNFFTRDQMIDVLIGVITATGPDPACAAVLNGSDGPRRVHRFQPDVKFGQKSSFF